MDPSATTITLLHKNCRRDCALCAYGPALPIGRRKVADIIRGLQAQGFLVQLYDFEVTADSLALFRLTGQYERPNPGWLNVGAGFHPSARDVAYLNGLETAVVISLHGSTPELHRISSGKDDFADVVRFIEEYPKRFTRPLGVNCVLGRHNLADIEEMVRFCRRFPLRFIEFIPLGFFGNARARLGPEAILSDAQKREAHRRIRALGRGGPFSVEMDAIWGPDFDYDAESYCRFFAPRVPGNYCNAGLNHFAVRLGDMRIFPCPCMASVDALSIGTYDGVRFSVERDWLDRKDRIGEPCRGCDRREDCRGGCRLTALSDCFVRRGRLDRYAGFESCLYHLSRRAAPEEGRAGGRVSAPASRLSARRRGGAPPRRRPPAAG